MRNVFLWVKPSWHAAVHDRVCFLASRKRREVRAELCSCLHVALVPREEQPQRGFAASRMENTQ